MEIRRKKKKTLSDKIFGAVVPLGGCAFLLLIAVLLCLRTLLGSGGPGMVTPTTLRSAEDLQYQLSNRQIHKEIHDIVRSGGSAVAGDKRSQAMIHGFRDPGSMDIELTPLEKSRVETMRLPKAPETVDTALPYDIHRCPATIPKNYPFAWSVLDVLKHWNPDDTRIPDTIHQGLCAIDWSDPLQRKIAVHYRKNEVPFIVKNHPVIWRVVDRWSDYNYLYEKLGDQTYRNEHSTNNHMMYWKLRNPKRAPAGWEPPTEDVNLSYPDWYQKATVIEDDPDSSSTAEHYYLRLNGDRRNNGWLFDDLTFFNPDIQNDIFMVDPLQARGINCRLGSRGIIAETHYDMSRNFIMILKGQKRYVLGHPDQCINMELYPNGHPSGRHSRINWSDPESWLHGGKNFRNGMVNEVVLDAGDGLYLPTYWLHFIVSLSLNYQCNARSGTTFEYQEHIRDCGFA